MLTFVMIGQLVRRVKKSSGLPIRKLAADARVAGSTITRIQSDAVDPTVNTLEKILNAAGFDLRIEAVRHGAQQPRRLGDLADAWTTRQGEVRLNWTRWRSLLDELALHPALVAEAIYIAPPPAGEPIIDTLLAAVAEKLADDAGLPRPYWTEQAPTLQRGYHPPLIRAGVEREVPAQLAARGLMIDTESLWRNPETVGA